MTSSTASAVITGSSLTHEDTVEEIARDRSRSGVRHLRGVGSQRRHVAEAADPAELLRVEAGPAHQRTVDQVKALPVEIITKAQVTGMSGDGTLSHVEITVDGAEPVVRPAQAVVAALGFIADLGALQTWGLETQKRHVVVDSAMRTNLPRVFAAGDITDYAGKVRLIAVGFGEAATAVNNAAVVIDPSAHVFPGHSSEG